ncbi:MAG: ABC transporter ATP-binding protein [Rhodospirillales bacterium]|jgi:ABC-2 type transport system ATP-binding protein|nr:ABC transporter ATP-binding protein [Rhodospirillales bacterium]
MRQSQDPVAAVKNLTKRFGEVCAVESISFTVAKGSTTALLGGNGAGKTTTLSMLLGLLLPTSGSVTVFGEDMVRHRHRVLPRMNFSSPYVDVPRRLTVLENLTVYGHLYGLDGVAARVRAIARDLEMEPLLRRTTGNLSSGQKTRVMLAKALLNEPDLLLLDEPTASLDPDTADWMRSYLEIYRARTGATIVLASHNMAEVERLCDAVVMLREGRIVDRGAPADLVARYGRRTLEEVFLDIARRRGAGQPGDSGDSGESGDSADPVGR